MKIAPSAYQQQNAVMKKKPLLPLEPEIDDVELTKHNSVGFELRSVPAEANSAKYKVVARILTGNESLSVIIKWYKMRLKVINGLNLNTYGPQVAIIQQMLSGTVLATFNTALNDAKVNARTVAARAAYEAEPDAALKQAAYDAIIAQALTDHEDVGQIKGAVQFALRELVPKKAVQRIKRWLRRECRKPADMKVRTFVQNIWRINTEEIPYTPPYNSPPLPEDEMIDILLFGTPKFWQKEMDRQGFDPMTKTLLQVVEFMENIETAEDFDGTPVPKKKDAKKSSSSNKASLIAASEKYCMLHGKGNHSTEECQKLKAEAKRLKSGSSSGGSQNKNYGSKTWKRSASDDKAKTKKELNAIVKKAIKEGVKKELAALDKKRKGSGSDSEVEVNAVDLDLKDFNYEDMENLTLSDTEDGEVSV